MVENPESNDGEVSAGVEGVGAEDSNVAAESAVNAPGFVVGVGASAGGLEALGDFFQEMPTGMGMAFVVIQHLSPNYKSFMAELLAKRTKLAVKKAEDGQVVEPDHVYLIQPGKNLTIHKGRLFTLATTARHGFNLPIDVFFRSLADDQGEKSIAVVLSGTGSDGTIGLRAIKEAGGMVMVQSGDSAKFEGMPRSAIQTGLADFILKPDEMGLQLAKFVKHPFTRGETSVAIEGTPEQEVAIQKVFVVLRDRFGIDFSFYKQATIERRIERRMSVCQVETIKDYLAYLESSERECTLLYNDLLICVTRFFRDHSAFTALEEKVLTEVFNTSRKERSVRIWVAGCSTGEEVYTMAIIISNIVRSTEDDWDVKIFGTDLSAEAVEIASRGIYNESILGDVPAEDVRNYFTKVPTGYQVSHLLRKMVVFARHDLLNDPPFTRLDLITCRNVLIYFQPVLQSKVLSTFQFALKPNGYLFLGTSETPGAAADRFETLDSRNKLYRKSQNSMPQLALVAQRLELPHRYGEAAVRRQTNASAMRAQFSNLEKLYTGIIDDYAPPTLVLDQGYNLRMTLGGAEEFLVMPGGSVTTNVLKMLPKSLGSAMASGLHQASKGHDEIVYKNVHVSEDDPSRMVDLRIRGTNLGHGAEEGFVVSLIRHEVVHSSSQQSVRELTMDEVTQNRINDLEQELAYTKESLQAAIEELETSNEELQASNEELMASNEELQSTNEELQSVNEELHTVNQENLSRIEDITRANNDIDNIMATSMFGVVLVDEDLRIRRVSEGVTKVLQIGDGDIGAPVELIGRALGFEGIVAMAQRCLREDEAISHEIDLDGRSTSLLVRISPYKTETAVTRGLVVSVIDVSEMKLSREELERKVGFTESIVAALPLHVVVLDSSGIIRQVDPIWDEFVRLNADNHLSHCRVGANYFGIWKSADAELKDTARRVEEMIRGAASDATGQEMLDFDISCEGRSCSYRLYVAPLGDDKRGVVVSHLRM